MPAALGHAAGAKRVREIVQAKTKAALTYGAVVGNAGNIGYGGGANTFNLGAVLGTNTGANAFTARCSRTDESLPMLYSSTGFLNAAAVSR